MEQHLSDRQIAQLLDMRHESSDTQPLDPATGRDLEVHLQSCESCSSRFRVGESAMERLNRLQSKYSTAPGPSCPPIGVWSEVVTGTRTKESEAYIKHAIECDHCGIQLKQAATDFMDELTPEEEDFIGRLRTATPEGQKQLATTLRSVHSSDRQRRPHFWGAWFEAKPRTILLYSAFTLAIVGGGGWFWLHWQHAHSPEALLAAAYSERRTLEIRFEGAPYSPLRQKRGTDYDWTHRPALLSAEAEISRQLQKHPNSAQWLQASGRASLLEDTPEGVESAVESLEKAHRLDPTDDSITTDLGGAYILRGNLTPIETDRGLAIQILKPLADSHRGGESALWNYALAEENTGLWVNALAAWQSFITRYPHSPWIGEAKAKERADQQRIQERQKRSSSELRSPAAVAKAFRQRDIAALADVDSRIEEYRTQAVTEWLPELLSGIDANRTSTLTSALDGVAAILKTRHNDQWLADLLKSNLNSPRTKAALIQFSHASELVETSDTAEAERESRLSESVFQAAGLPAGAAGARLIRILAAQYEHRDSDCRVMAEDLRRDLRTARYPWIVIQANLETSLCSQSATSEAIKAGEAASSLAQSDHFPILYMRCLTTQIFLYSSMGDRDRAWSKAAESLNLYWKGNLPKLRGYNALIGIADLCRSDQWYLRADILREAIPMIAGDPRTLMLAVANAHYGQALERIGNLQDAEIAYRRSQLLIHSSESGPERDALNAEAELGLARLELDRGLSAESQRRLVGIRPAILKMEDSPIQMDFLETSALALLANNRIDEAERDAIEAVDHADSELRGIPWGQKRWDSEAQFDELYHTIVQVELRKSPARALFAWEHLRGLALLNDQRTAFIPISNFLTTPIPRSKAGPLIICYVEFSSGVAAWAWDDSGIREEWIPIKRSALSSLISKFTEECSDPDSNLAILKADGASLYKILIKPVESWTLNRRQLVIEPDGELQLIPFQALVDDLGRYLGERTAVSISLGSLDLSSQRQWRGVTRESAAFVLGNPQGIGRNPLPAADEEARAVASLFEHPDLEIGRPSSTNELLRKIASSEVFHFAGHGRVDFDGAGLVAGDGQLSAQSIYDAARNGRTVLAVLSACNTSQSSTGLFDGGDSIVRGLLAAHVPNVVASRWSIDSSSTALLMKVFYTSLLNGRPVNQSLAEATRAVRSTKSYEHPYYWAAFSVFGFH